MQTVATGATDAENIDLKRILLDASYQGVNRLFVMGFNNNRVEGNSNKRYFLPRIKNNDYNV